MAPALALRRGTLKFPVFLGDSMQLAVFEHFREKTLDPACRANGGTPTTLDFPELLAGIRIFSTKRSTFCAALPRAALRGRNSNRGSSARSGHYAYLRTRFPDAEYRDYGDDEAQAVTDIGATYLVYDRLRRDGRDSIWAYVARNLSRPLAYSAGGGWANVVIGNPPWVAFRHMSADLQKRFKELAQGIGVYVGGCPVA